MATPHIESKLEDIASIVIMPGDPLRAKFIAENFLEDAKLINKVRNVLGYTGYYKNKKVTVFASGMGLSSMSIYAYELYKFYNVETIIRIGSVGTYKEHLNLFDLILVEKSFTASNFAKVFGGEDVYIVDASSDINSKIISMANSLNMSLIKGNINCSEVFYSMTKDDDRIDKYNCLGVEMESFALFYIAKKLNKKAATVLTVSDSIKKQEKITSEEREKSFKNMILLVLETVSNKI